MSRTKLLFFAGSARQGSFNKTLAKLGAKLATEAGIDATFADLRDYPMPVYDGDMEEADGRPENAHKFKEVLAAHHGVFIIGPEYNSSLSPLLKNTIDWISRLVDPQTRATVFKGRTFALGSATAGTSGGVRSMLALRQVLSSGLAGFVLPEQMSLPTAHKAFDENGELLNPANEAHFLKVIQALEHTANRLSSNT